MTTCYLAGVWLRITVRNGRPVRLEVFGDAALTALLFAARVDRHTPKLLELCLRVARKEST